MDGKDIDLRLINIDAEKALLGCLISDEKLVNKCIDKNLKSIDFFDSGYSFLYDLILNLYKNKKPIEPISLISEVKKVGGNIYASAITEMALTAIPSNINFYIDEIKRLSWKRNLKDRLESVIDELSSADDAEISEHIESIVKESKNTDEIKNMFCELAEVKRVDVNDGLQLGFSELDNLTNGIVFGSLTILTGEPSAGKSTILNQVIANNIMNGYKCMIYSGELTSFNILHWFMRTVANESDLKQFTGKNGIYYDVDSHGEHEIRKWIKDRFYLFSEDNQASIENLTGVIDYLAREKGLKLAVIDNLMTIENGSNEELEKQKKIAKALKLLARKYKMCIILVAHPKKKDRNDKYHMHDVSGASEIVNLADYEFLLTRTVSDNDDITRMIILKNRITGNQGIVRVLKFDTTRKRFWINRDELYRDYKYSQINQISFEKINDEAPF
ncbi:DnaB-like helicase C-terminal domain-containing protein [Peptostreptococcus porci]|uniref:DnaB-like helicase C-terminal domain-containing protein n=1 Tax=Peptostreptococcus porci TaxID=2652282 RepID=UPI002A840CB2|nr:DnaB-like helicase C-terminal domain-containing protein [Peptostreptococcus porci]MDY4128817.1 DnaB-like helicase C-terminal domain-containing protein [Peptostreptococcus porci]